jgi:hypothetical protein
MDKMGVNPNDEGVIDAGAVVNCLKGMEGVVVICREDAEPLARGLVEAPVQVATQAEVPLIAEEADIRVAGVAALQ